MHYAIHLFHSCSIRVDWVSDTQSFSIMYYYITSPWINCATAPNPIRRTSKIATAGVVMYSMTFISSHADTPIDR